MNTVAFPSLGIELTLKKTAIQIGGFSIQWYGILIAIGFGLAVWYCTRRCVRFGISEDNLIDMALYATPIAIIGARLYYVVFNWSEFRGDPISVLYIWNGGIALYGSLIFALAAAAIYCKVKKINVWNMFDLGVLGFMIGQIVGRWGNFVNAEAYGVEVENWFLGLSINGGPTVHPNFLYESVWNLLGFILLHFLSKKRRFYGQTFLSYIAWYGIGRGIFEGIRGGDTLMLFQTGLRVSQVLGFLSALVALGVLAYKLLFSDRSDTIYLLTDEEVLEARAFSAAQKRMSQENGAQADAEEAPAEAEPTPGDSETEPTPEDEQ